MTGGILVEQDMQPRALFGGAIEMHLPDSFADVSDRVPVPDHQEVFAESSEDISIIVEINEHVDSMNDECGAFYFQNLAEVSEATGCSVSGVSALGSEELPGVRPWHYGCIVEGRQLVSKGRQGPECANEVHVTMAVIRLPHVSTDILVILNNPMYIHPSSSSAAATGSGMKPQHPGMSGLFKRLLASFRIVDYGLFGSG